ncbi:MAG TPA: hypothetical protein VEL82_05740 [Thermoplasmata archaeon]|nr:hypothetical protein [Thermoplasmata archaeon]
MVYIEDTGSLIDAPIDFIWEYLGSEGHGAAHSGSARNFRVRETIGSTAVVVAERRLHGRWSTFVSRSTDFPPFCVCNEEIEGDFAGTKFVLLYRPEGNVTRVDVFGDVRSSVFDGAEAKRIFLGFLQSAYEDDTRAIRDLRARRAK